MNSNHRAALTRLLAVGVSGLCGCGALAPPVATFNDNLTEEAACLDLWSLVHFSSGYYIGTQAGDESFLPTALLLTGYEVVEPRIWPGFNESELNQRCDVVVGSLGWLVETLASD